MIAIKVGQVYKSKTSDFQILIAGKKRDKWLAKVLTDKPGVYNDTHTMSRFTLKKRFDLIQ